MVMHFNTLFGTNNWGISGARLRVTELGAPPNTLFNRGQGAFEIRWIANDNWLEGTNPPTAPATNGIAYNDESTLLNSAIDSRLGTFTNAGVEMTQTLALALPIEFTTDLKAGGEVSLFLNAIDPGTGFTMDSRSFRTVAERPFLEISAAPRPGITAIHLSETNVVLAATNGAADGTYCVLSTTNLALFLNQWSPVAPNILAGSRGFSITVTNAVPENAPSHQFFIIRAQ
jgi:hypothetical protein